MEAKMKYGYIIFLNGALSAGKTSIAGELIKHLEGFNIAELDNKEAYSGYLPKSSDPTIDDYVSGFNHYVQDLASEGKNVIVDHVLQEIEWAKQCADLFCDFNVTLVKVYCPEEQLKERILKRRGSLPEPYYEMAEIVHQNKIYDVVVDTFKHTPRECAAQILEYFQSEQLSPTPTQIKFHNFSESN